MTFWILFITWLAGFIFVYILARAVDREELLSDYSFKHVFINLGLSIFSWAFIIYIVAAVLIMRLYERLATYFKETKPPQWL